MAALKNDVKTRESPKERVALSHIFAEVFSFWDHRKGCIVNQNHEFPTKFHPFLLDFAWNPSFFFEKKSVNISSKKLMTVGWIFCTIIDSNKSFATSDLLFWWLEQQKSTKMVANNGDLPTITYYCWGKKPWFTMGFCKKSIGKNSRRKKTKQTNENQGKNGNLPIEKIPEKQKQPNQNGCFQK